ncbi:MAG: sensor domain-containing diguanylate cyclase [Planctomycetes bacterium]|nr:sensor domain-containing diguanylate cyclase [Planctomycetota bacterium]
MKSEQYNISDLGEDIFRVFFEACGDLQYVLDPFTAKFVLINGRFTDVLGYDREEIESGDVRISDIVHPEDHAKILGFRPESIKENVRYLEGTRHSFRARCKDGIIKHLEVTAKAVKFGDKVYLVGSARDVTLRKKAEKKSALAQETLAKHNLAICSLVEKLRVGPELATKLLSSSSVDEVLERAANVFSDRRAFPFDVFIFVTNLGDETKVRARQIRGNTGGNIHDVLLQQFLQTEQEDVFEKEACLFALRRQDKKIGAICAKFAKREWEIMNDAPQVAVGVKNHLQAMCQDIGLAIENQLLIEKIERASVIDSLTGVFNRRFLDEKLDEEFRRALRYDRELSLLVVDLDRFKNVNDDHPCGHLQGDQILVEIADLLGQNFRDSDFVCRYGGDEFFVLMPETSQEDAYAKGRALGMRVSQHGFTDLATSRRDLGLTMSIGVASVATSKAETPHDLMKAADRALYQSKEAGRNCITAVD